MNNSVNYIEADKNIRNITEALNTGNYNVWNAERIKSAFNFRRGTIEDFYDYAARNAKYCNIFNMESGEKIN